MVMERIGMRKIKEVLRLRFEKELSSEKIARCCGLGKTSVRRYISRFKAAGFTWPLAEEITDELLEQRLFPKDPGKEAKKYPLNYEYLVEEKKKPDVTLALLWEEYKETHSEGYSYPQFCSLYRAYKKTLNYSMRQEHKAGEKVFADFGIGDAVKLVNPETGERLPVNLFVCVWGASNYTYAQAVIGEETLLNWLNCSVSGFEYSGCSPKVLVPDNPKATVSRACRYEPDVNPTYAEFAQHYNVVVFPARPRHAKDKAKVEVGVKLAKRWILARLRNRTFFSLGQLNEDIFELLEVFNNKVMKRLKKSRRELFEVLDKPNAQPLPEKRYQFTEWKTVKVNIDYHVEFDEHYYSVPYTLAGQKLEVRAATNLVEIFKKGERIHSHCRSYKTYPKSVTIPEHMPKSHREHLEWSPSRIQAWAEKYGSEVKELVNKIMSEQAFPEKGYRSCLGIIRLERKYSAEKLNKACGRALKYHSHSYTAVKNILLRGLESLEETKTGGSPIIQHENIRGSKYYDSGNPSLN